MSSNVQVSSSSTPSFQQIFEKALEEYKKKTGKDLTTDPLAAQIKGCNSPGAILTVLEGKANKLNQTRGNDERLTKWLNPTVNILSALSATLGQGAGLVFPPTTILFSGIGILLVAAKSTTANRDVLLKLFARIESFFERLKIYTNVPPSPAVTDELAKILADVLSILGIATKAIKERRIKLFFKKVAGMNDLEDALQRLGELEQRELLTGIAQVSSDTARFKDDAKATKACVDETKAMVKEIVDKMDARDLEEVIQKVIRWLSPPDPSTNYAIGLRDLHEETATWFLEGAIFQEWYSTGSLLWINGKPGSGKSILCSAIIRRILSLCDGGRALVAYFYFDFRDENKKHRHNLLPSLLVQFATHSITCCDIISRVYSSHGRGTQQPSDEVMINCLTNMLSSMTQHPIYIIVDALDESPNTSGVRSPRARVLSLIKDLVNLCLPNLHICATSRPEVDIRLRLKPLTARYLCLHDQSGHKEDIAKYIWSEVNFIADEKRWRQDDKDLVIEALSEEADGMFRWVFCQLEVLRLCLRSRLWQFLHELPKSLDETYERVLKEIHETNRGYAHRLLQCLSVAVRPLTVDEHVAILTLDPEATEGNVSDWRLDDLEQELLSVCPSLITIVDGTCSRVVQFSHFSVKEFLTSDRLANSSEDISGYHILPDAAHTTLAQGSLDVLLHRLDHRINRSGVGCVSQADYAVLEWVSHAQFGRVSMRVMDSMKTLFDPEKPHFSAWVQKYDLYRYRYSSFILSGLNRSIPPEEPPKPLYYSAFCGLYDLVEHLVKKHPQDLNPVGRIHDSPLAAALLGGYIRVAELLLQHGANVGIQGSGGRTPLHIVIGSYKFPTWTNNFAVDAVQFLLKHGADVNAREMDLSTPLHLAACQEYFEVAQMLLLRGVDVNSRNVRGESPLHLVWKVMAPRREGNGPRLVQLLLEYGAEVNYRDEEDSTPLHYASLRRDLENVMLLLNHGAYVKAEDNQRRTPLHRVLQDEHYPEKDRFGVVQLLVERGADVNARDKDYETPLHLASHLSELNSVQILLAHGANVNAEDSSGQTPLNRVLNNKLYFGGGRFGVVQLLVEHGADVNSRDKDHESPLHLASYILELNSVRMLLDHGADVHAVDNQGRTPLRRMSENEHYPRGDHFGVAQLLVEHGADVNARDKYYQTTLHLVSFHVLELKLVRMLLDNGANVNVKDNWARTPLHQVLEGTYYSGEDCFGVVQLFVERGADVNARSEYNETPLHLASFYSGLETVRMLLDHGANVNAEDNRHRTPLHRVLEEVSSDIGPEHYYYDEYCLSTAQLLMEHGADVNIPDNNGETPVHLASRLGSLNLAWTLLKHGADLHVENNQGKTPSQLTQEYIRRCFNRLPSGYPFGDAMRREWRAKCIEYIAIMGLLYG